MDSLRLPAHTDHLEQFRQFVDSRAEAAGISPGMISKVELALEEALVNVMHYAYGGGEGDVEVDCAMEECQGHPAFVIRILDSGPAFDPLKKEAPDLQADIDHRPIGGLGIFLVHEMTDHLAYTRKNDTNQLKLCFHVRES